MQFTELAKASTGLTLPIGGERSSRSFRDPHGSLMRGTTRKNTQARLWDAGDEKNTEGWGVLEMDTHEVNTEQEDTRQIFGPHCLRGAKDFPRLNIM